MSANSEQSQRNENPNSDDGVKQKNYKPILECVNSINPDVTQKIMIIYGIAAHLHKIHENESIKVNVTPNYIFLDDDLLPFIDLDNLNSVSKKQSANDFLASNKDFAAYLPKEVNENETMNNSNSRMKVDSYIFGGICLSLMAKIILEEDCNTLELVYDSIAKNNISQNLGDLINSCLHEIPIYRPMFSDILYIIDSLNFLNEFDDFDIDKFKKYQKTVINEEFIQPLNPDFDIAKISNVPSFKHIDFRFKKCQKPIGSGISGEVYKVAKKSDPSIIVAYKKFHKSVSGDNLKRIFREIEILASVKHYAVQNLYGYVTSPKSKGVPTAVLTLFEEKGSLINYVEKKSKYGELNFTQKYIIMYGIAAGMCYLHEEGIAHRDLKPENILLNSNFEPLITDFGLSKKVSKNELFQSTHLTGTPFYMAPELLTGTANDKTFFSLFDAKPADVYAFAILVYVLFSGLKPFKDSLDVQRKVPAGQRPAIPNDFPKLIALLIQACWADDPQTRPSFDAILLAIGHPAFLSKVDDSLDLVKFNEYQKKVVSEEHLNDNVLSTENESDISFDEILFSHLKKDI